MTTMFESENKKRNNTKSKNKEKSRYTRTDIILPSILGILATYTLSKITIGSTESLLVEGLATLSPPIILLIGYLWIKSELQQ